MIPDQIGTAQQSMHESKSEGNIGLLSKDERCQDNVAKPASRKMYL